MVNVTESHPKWLDSPLPFLQKRITPEHIVFLIIIVLAILSRFYALGDRALSHDESIHIYYSYLFSIGQGYYHTPLSHGPFQFHIIALLFSLFKTSDFIGRLPHAIASVLSVVALWHWRSYLGRIGTLIAAFLLVISPFMLFYGRYARNEPFVGLIGIISLYTILRYLEAGRDKYLFLLTLVTALHFTVKETAFIYTAQALVFLGIVFILRSIKVQWRKVGLLHPYILSLVIGILLLGTALGLILYNRGLPMPDAELTASPSIPGQELEQLSGPSSINSLSEIILFISLAGGGSIVISGILLMNGLGWQKIRRERAFSILILLGTFVLPQLTAFPAKWMNWDPLDYQFTWPGWDFSAIFSQAPAKTALVFLLLLLISVFIGLVWGGKRWVYMALLFWGIYIFFYTSIFTNLPGFFTGSVGSLGYWLEQQAVKRGNQPWFYYLLLQIPLYEFLPLLGLFLATCLGLRHKFIFPKGDSIAENPDNENAIPVLGILIWWSISSLFAFTIAGEKMPWLTVHITLPMILLTGWGLGQIVERIDWVKIPPGKRISTFIGILIFSTSFGLFLLAIIGSKTAFGGKTLAQLSDTAAVAFWGLIAIFSGLWLYFHKNRWNWWNYPRLVLLVCFGYLTILTGRTAFRAAYINAENATEYLVYAHGASGIKDALNQIVDISQTASGGYDQISISYDAGGETQGVSWPWKWYMRNFPNAKPYYTADESLLGSDIIVADPQSFSEVDALVGDEYYQLEVQRMVWPNQDYFNLTWSSISALLADNTLQEAMYQIWFNRDYSLYAEITGKHGFTVSEWFPSDPMRVYIRKNIAKLVWEYNLLNQDSLRSDPYEQGFMEIPADFLIGSLGTEMGQFNSPHGIAIASDGSLFVADTWNHRIQQFSPEGEFLNSWGTYADINNPGGATPGTFNQPSAVELSPEGAWFYVVDTWNHRIQKLSITENLATAWGFAFFHATLGDPFGLWGPRDIAVDNAGRIFITDTGNKRVIVYDAEGNYVAQFGGEGSLKGQLNEPVGIDIDDQGLVYIADTWNQRIQVFSPDELGTAWTPILSWDIAGWYGDSLENKPLLALDDSGHIFITDPIPGRILEFTTSGAFIRAWNSSFSGLVSGIAVDDQGHIWISDAQNNVIARYSLP